MIRHTLMPLSLTATVVTLLLVGTALAVDNNDTNPPGWFDPADSNTTLQQWWFDSNDVAPWPAIFPGRFSNLWGALQATVTPDPAVTNPWLPSYLQGDGVWYLSQNGQVDLNLKNNPNPHPMKELWVQVRWQPSEMDAEPFLWAESPGSVVTPAVERMSDRQAYPGGWIHSTYQIFMYPSPSLETVSLRGNIYLDTIVVDTWSTLPEPATALLLAAGAAALLPRRRQRG